MVLQLMQKEFETRLKRKSTRERFYSSMNYEEYFQLFGPPAPLIKPLEDPELDIPDFDLQPPVSETETKNEPDKPVLEMAHLDTIQEIDGSQNFTQNYHHSPRLARFDLFEANLFNRDSKQVEDPSRRVRVRMRSQSDNSEYLIFNFLQRNKEKGRKRVKID